MLYGMTGLAAEALGIDDELGTLSPGKIADYGGARWRPEHRYFTPLQRVHLVIKDGRDRGARWRTDVVMTSNTVKEVDNRW